MQTKFAFTLHLPVGPNHYIPVCHNIRNLIFNGTYISDKANDSLEPKNAPKFLSGVGPSGELMSSAQSKTNQKKKFSVTVFGNNMKKDEKLKLLTEKAPCFLTCDLSLITNIKGEPGDVAKKALTMLKLVQTSSRQLKAALSAWNALKELTPDEELGLINFDKTNAGTGMVQLTTMLGQFEGEMAHEVEKVVKKVKEVEVML